MYRKVYAKMQSSSQSRPLIKYENVNFRLKKVASFQAKKVNNLNGIEKR